MLCALARISGTNISDSCGPSNLVWHYFPEPEELLSYTATSEVRQLKSSGCYTKELLTTSSQFFLFGNQYLDIILLEVSSKEGSMVLIMSRTSG